jgi:hypothetical protein
MEPLTGVAIGHFLAGAVKCESLLQTEYRSSEGVESVGVAVSTTAIEIVRHPITLVTAEFTAY